MEVILVEQGESIHDPVVQGGHAQHARGSRGARWGGRVSSGVAIAFLAVDAAVKVLELAPAVEGTARLGYPTSVVLGLGIVELACVAAYAIPRTSALGAILLTGYLGGAVATHVRVADPLLTHVLFPIYVAVLVWGGVYLRDRRVRELVAPSARRPPRASRVERPLA